MIPSGGDSGWATEDISCILLAPRQAPVDKIVAYSRKCLSSDIWYAKLGIAKIQVFDSADVLQFELNIPRPASKVDLCFDQLDRPCLTWQNDLDEIYLYWYDPTIPGYVTTKLANATNPCCQVDNYTVNYLPLSDILVFYQQGDIVKFRRQRDRFNTEYQVPHNLQDIVLDTCGFGTNWRFVLRIYSIDAVIVTVENNPVMIGGDTVGFKWGTIPWAKSSSNTGT